MDWLLTILAVFNAFSMVTIFTPRAVPRKAIPWAVYFTTLLATELAWIWLPLQIVLALSFIIGGALESGMGQVAFLVLFCSWSSLVWAIYKSAEAKNAVEEALLKSLGKDYLEDLPASTRAKFRQTVEFADWCNPVKMKRPGVEVIRRIPYGPHGVRQQLDIYRPDSIPEGGCPVLFQIHGGGWTFGDKGGQALPLMYHLANKGWICVAVNYRLSPSVGFPVHLFDCKKALCWVKENGAEYGMDTSFIAVTGGSAGGHLTALMGLTENRADLQPDNPGADTSVQAVVPLYGFYDFLERYNQSSGGGYVKDFLQDKVMHQSPEENPALWDLASPITLIHKGVPPFMIWHGTHDSLVQVKGARIFAEKLREVSDNPVVYAEIPGAEHAWEIVRSLRTEHTVDGVHRFLEWVLAKHRAALPEEINT